MSLHSHNYFELEYPFSGNCRQVFKNDSFEFTRGDIAFFKPESRHAFFVSDEAKMLRITIKPTYMPKIYDRFENEFSNMNIILQARPRHIGMPACPGRWPALRLSATAGMLCPRVRSCWLRLISSIRVNALRRTAHSS